ncbi:MAG TPA: hypothetical protein VGM78_00365 [Ilumatobacteraceae bacterium]
MLSVLAMSNEQLGRVLTALLGVMLIVMASIGLRNFWRGRPRRGPR